MLYAKLVFLIELCPTGKYYGRKHFVARVDFWRFYSTENTTQRGTLHINVINVMSIVN